jgi:hypothetical protein
MTGRRQTRFLIDFRKEGLSLEASAFVHVEILGPGGGGEGLRGIFGQKFGCRSEYGEPIKEKEISKSLACTRHRTSRWNRTRHVCRLVSD